MTEQPRRNGGLDDLRDLIEAKLASHAELHRQHEEAHTREHKMTDLAILKAEQATGTALTRAQEVVDERFKAANEWRGAMNDRERTLVQKAEWGLALTALQARLDKLEDADIARATREQERERALTRTMALIGLAAAVGGFILSLLTRLLGIGAS